MDILQLNNEKFDFILELAGFIINLVYLYFIIRENSLAWVWSIISCLIFMWVCLNSQLYLQSGLYLFYILISIYGLRKWKSSLPPVVQSYSQRFHVYFILVCLLFGFILGYVFATHTDQDLPYLDGLITSFAVCATWRLVAKDRENWLYWMVINLASIYLYFSQGLHWLATMALILFWISIRGYKAWLKK